MTHHHTHHGHSESHVSDHHHGDGPHRLQSAAKQHLQHEYVQHLKSQEHSVNHGADGHTAVHASADAGAHEAVSRIGKHQTESHLTIPPAHYGESKASPAARNAQRESPLALAQKTDSIDKLVGAGVIKAADKPVPGAAEQARPGDAAAKPSDAQIRDTKTNPVKSIDVVYQDQSGDKSRPAQQPDFIVKKDGSVEVIHNPDHDNNSKIVVEVERNAGDRSAPPAVEQKAVDDLVSYLSGRYMPDVKRPDGTVGKDGQIDDPQGLVSDKTKAGLHTNPDPEEQLSEQARNQIHQINRWHGSGGGKHGGDGGRFTPRQAADQFPRRDVPRQPGEDDKLAALKDIAAGFITRGDKDPYHAVHSRGSHGFGVGRYGITKHSFMDWLSGLSDAEIEKLIQEGKLPKGALDLKNGKHSPEADKLGDFLNKMGSGQGNISKAEIDQFLPKQLQERIGSDLVKKYAWQTADRGPDGRPTGVNVGKVALSMALDRPATDADAAKPENQQLMNAAQQAYPLALEHAMNGFANIDLSDAAKKIVSAARGSLGQALWTNHAAATQYGNLGCAASVSTVLRDAGVARVDETGVDGLANNLRSHGWKAVSFENRQPGDVIIALGPRHGHTGIVGENRNVTYDNHSSNGRWSPDSAGYWLRGLWNNVYVLRAPSA